MTVKKGKDILNPAGRFAVVGKDNKLVYKVEESLKWRRQNNIPAKIILEGKWSLDARHNLVFNLNKTETQYGNQRLLLKGQIVELKAKALVFSLGTKGKAGTHSLRLLQLKGKWQADKYNRIQFLVKKLKSSYDTLTFQGDWQVKNNSLIYTYQKISLKTKFKQIYTLSFQGHWQIDKKNQITYILDEESGSGFAFKAYLETPSLIGKKGAIKYRVGIGLKGRKQYQSRIVTLYGVWKLHRKTGLSLELDHNDGTVQAVRFGAFIRPGKADKITLGLRNRQGEALGITLEFSRTFIGNNASWFLRAVNQGRCKRLEWGAAVKW